MDKQKVNLLESSGLLSKGKRYLMVSKKFPSASQVFVYSHAYLIMIQLR